MSENDQLKRRGGGGSRKSQSASLRGVLRLRKWQNFKLQNVNCSGSIGLPTVVDRNINTYSKLGTMCNLH